MKNISRNEIADFIYEKFGLAKKDCFDIVNDLFEEIIKGLIQDKKVKIHNFGTFKRKSKKERIGRNPKTKENFMISSRNVVTFSISKNILDTINTKADGKKI
jgi:integration host factor subunit alpha